MLNVLDILTLDDLTLVADDGTEIGTLAELIPNERPKFDGEEYLMKAFGFRMPNEDEDDDWDDDYYEE